MKEFFENNKEVTHDAKVSTFFTGIVSQLESNGAFTPLSLSVRQCFMKCVLEHLNVVSREAGAATEVSAAVALR